MRTAFINTRGLALVMLSAMATGCLAPSSEPNTSQAEEDVTCGRICLTGINRTTLTGGASTSSCAAATTALDNFLHQEADADCVNIDEFSCGLVITITNACFAVGSSVQINGYASYHCGHTTC